jgi:hypothetical protein
VNLCFQKSALPRRRGQLNLSCYLDTNREKKKDVIAPFTRQVVPNHRKGRRYDTLPATDYPFFEIEVSTVSYWRVAKKYFITLDSISLNGNSTIFSFKKILDLLAPYVLHTYVFHAIGLPVHAFDQTTVLDSSIQRKALQEIYFTYPLEKAWWSSEDTLSCWKPWVSLHNTTE